MKRGILVDDRADRPPARRAARRSMQSRHRPAAARRRRQPGFERAGGVDLHRPHGDVGKPEQRLQHLALLGHAQRAVDRSRRLRLQRQVGRPAAAADAAAAPVKQRHSHAVAPRTRPRSLPAPCRDPSPAVERARRPWPNRSSRSSLPAGRAMRARYQRHGRAACRAPRRRAAGRATVSNSGTTRSGAATPAAFCSSSTASTSDARRVIVITYAPSDPGGRARDHAERVEHVAHLGRRVERRPE